MNLEAFDPNVANSLLVPVPSSNTGGTTPTINLKSSNYRSGSSYE